MLYIDTGLFAKLYVPEPESAAVQAVVSGCDGLLSSELLVTEFASVLQRKMRERSLSKRDETHIWRLFEKHLHEGLMTLVPLNRDVTMRAAALLRDLPGAVPLRSLDAIHLATCRYFAGRGTRLFTGDATMLAAAQALALRVVELPAP